MSVTVGQLMKFNKSLLDKISSIYDNLKNVLGDGVESEKIFSVATTVAIAASDTDYISIETGAIDTILYPIICSSSAGIVQVSIYEDASISDGLLKI